MRSIPAIEDLRERAQWVAWSHNKVPINPHTGKAASSTDASTWGTLAEAKWRRSTASLPGVGYVFSESDPYVGVDLDHAIDPATGEMYGWAENMVRGLDSYTEYSPSGLGLHVIVEADTMERWGCKRAVDGKDTARGAVEMYCAKRYFTVTGKHVPGTRRTIEERGEGIAKLAVWCGLRGPEGPSEPSSAPVGSAGYESEEDVSTWLHSALSAISSEDYHEWIRIGMGLKSELGESGFAWWDEWSRTSPKYKGRDKTWRAWCKLPASNDIGFGSIVYMAEQGGWVRPTRVREMPAGFDIDWEGWIAQQDEGSLIQDAPEADAGLGVKWISLADAYEDETPFEPPLIAPGVLGPGDIMVVFGPPKSGKSMLLLDMLTRFAVGKEWHGMHPVQPLTVAYMQFELKADAMRQRVQRLDLSADDLEEMRNRFWYTERFSCVIGPDLFAEVQAARQAWPWLPDVLVIDPISNVFGGQSENDNTEMMKFVRQLTALRNAFSSTTALVLVHHASKGKREDRNADPFQTLRGAGALRGVYDTGIFVDAIQKDGERRVNVQFELRNGAPLPELWFEHRAADGLFSPIDIEATKDADRASRRDRLRSMEQNVFAFVVARIAANNGECLSIGGNADAWAVDKPGKDERSLAFQCVCDLIDARQLGLRMKVGTQRRASGHGYVVRVSDNPEHAIKANPDYVHGAKGSRRWVRAEW